MTLSIFSHTTQANIFFFFFIDKKQIYKYTKIRGREQKNPEIHGTCTKGLLNTKQQQNKETAPKKKKNYLLPNHVKKSTTECMLSTVCRLAQDHKLVTKLALILWAEGTSFSNTNLFLARQRFQNRHNGAANQIFLRFLPTAAPCQARRLCRTECGKTQLIPTIDKIRSHNILANLQ